MKKKIIEQIITIKEKYFVKIFYNSANWKLSIPKELSKYYELNKINVGLKSFTATIIPNTNGITINFPILSSDNPNISNDELKKLESLVNKKNEKKTIINKENGKEND